MLNNVLLIRGLEGSGREYLADWISSHNEYFPLRSNSYNSLKTHSPLLNTLDFTKDNYISNFKNILDKVGNKKVVMPWMPKGKISDPKLNFYCIKVLKEYGKLVALEYIRKNLLSPNLFKLKNNKHLVTDKKLIKDFISKKRHQIDLDLYLRGKNLDHRSRLNYIESIINDYENNQIENEQGIYWHDLFFADEVTSRLAAKKVVDDLKLTYDSKLIERIVNRNQLNKKNLLEFDLDKVLSEYSRQND